MKYTRLKPRLHLLLLKKQFFEEIKLKLFLEWIRKLKHFNVSVCTRELRIFREGTGSRLKRVLRRTNTISTEQKSDFTSHATPDFLSGLET